MRTFQVIPDYIFVMCLSSLHQGSFSIILKNNFKGPLQGADKSLIQEFGPENKYDSVISAVVIIVSLLVHTKNLLYRSAGATFP